MLQHFPRDEQGSSRSLSMKYSNAAETLTKLGIPVADHNDNTGFTANDRASGSLILKMISFVSCSENGNQLPTLVQQTGAYHLLIPRWADRLEAVGARGVVRCYQYNREQYERQQQLGLSPPSSSSSSLSSESTLFSDKSPRPKSEEELWALCDAMPNRLQEYMDRGGTSTDMISHYYDKLLPVAKPPKDYVRNDYLETQADLGAQHLVQVCIRFGRSGTVDVEYIQQVMDTLKR